MDDEAANAFKYWVAGQLGDRIDSINPETKDIGDSLKSKSLRLIMRAKLVPLKLARAPK